MIQPPPPLSKLLIKDGISQHQAYILERDFGTQEDFISGMASVVAFLASNEIPDQAAPEALPWCDIWDAINTYPDDKMMLFQQAISAYPDDVRTTLDQVVRLKISNRQSWQQSTAHANKSPQYYMTVLANLGYRFVLNDCTGQIEVNGRPLDDYVHAEIDARCWGAGIKELHIVEKNFTAAAAKNKVHPIRKYLNNLHWQGEDTIGELATYFTDKDGMFGPFIRRWLIGACARVFRTARNTVLVLDGPQFMGKSLFVRWLGSPMSEYFREGAIEPENKDHRLALLRSWVWEISEFGAIMRKEDREALKAFLTTNTVNERGAYQKHSREGRAMTSFIATAQAESGFFNDPTGSTRFMTVNLTSINWKGYSTAIDIDQLWAQAMELYNSGEPWELSDVERARAGEINENYRMLDIVSETILKLFYIDPGNENIWLSSLQIIDALKDPNQGNLKAGNEVDMRRVASALTGLGLDKPKQGQGTNRGKRGYYGIRFLP